MKDKLILRVNLEGKDAARFKIVKDRLGLTNNTDVLRFLIKRASELDSNQPVEVPA